MNIRSFFTASFVGIALCAGSANAFADVLPPDSAGCDNADPSAVGDACMTDQGASGTCQAHTCSSLDYSNRDDAGAPGTRMYACAICVTPDGGAPTTSGDGGPVTTASADGGGCNLGGADAGGAALLGLGFPLLARRRKRASRKTS